MARHVRTAIVGGTGARESLNCSSQKTQILDGAAQSHPKVLSVSQFGYLGLAVLQGLGCRVGSMFLAGDIFRSCGQTSIIKTSSPQKGSTNSR